MPRRMRSNPSMLTCSLCPFRVLFSCHGCVVQASYLSINLQHATMQLSTLTCKMCPSMSTGLNVPLSSHRCAETSDAGSFPLSTVHVSKASAGVCGHTCYLHSLLHFQSHFPHFWLVLCAGALKSFCASVVLGSACCPCPHTAASALIRQ